MPTPSEESYRFLIENEWRDIHHSRIQEWSALGLIAAAHAGLFAFVDKIKSEPATYLYHINLIYVCSIIDISFALLGLILVCRHRRLMWLKLNWIFDANDKLGLIKKSANPNGIIPENYWKQKYRDSYLEFLNKPKVNWNKLKMPRPFSTSGLMAMLYIILGIIDVFILFSA